MPLFKENYVMRNTDENVALLKDLMSVPPMSATQHALIMRKRIEDRRMAEDKRELSRAKLNDYRLSC